MSTRHFASFKKRTSSSVFGGASEKDFTLLVLLVLVVGVLLLALCAPLIAPYDPYAADYALALAPPSAEHLFGCDGFGRDLFSRVIYGARLSVIAGLACILLTAFLGTAIGVCAALAGGVVDNILMRITDMFMAFPEIILGIAIVGILGPSTENVLVAVVAVSWVRFARIARGLVLSLKESEFVFTARLSGCNWAQVVVRHIMPNILPEILASAALELGYVMLTLAAFSFLGLGVQPPTPEWGYMLNEGRSYFSTAPHLMLFPGLALFATVLLFNLLSNTLNDRVSAQAGRA